MSAATATDFDLTMMRRAISLAIRGRGTVEPNPSVGCLIVKDRQIIGAGHTQPYGGPHAEPTALASCTESPEGATAYVTLEPCCHTNKKTPPCVPAVIAAGIKRLVVGALDPNPEVNGKGLAMLRDAGIEVVGPVLESEAKQLIAPFLTRVQHNRPYVTLKWAQTDDGKVAGAGGRRMQITSPRSSHLVHQLRSRSQAILVGIGTVLADDPLLTARDVNVSPAKQPIRLVLDGQLRTPLHSQLVRTVDEVPVHVYFSPGGHATRIRELTLAGVQTHPLPHTPSGLDLRKLLDGLNDLTPLGVTHLLVEPGPTLARSFLDAGLADRVWVFRSPKVADDDTAPSAAVVPSDYPTTGRLDIRGDVLTEYLNPRSDVYFATAESADLILARQSVQNGSD